MLARMNGVLRVTCACACLACIGGCREDLIDATPVNSGVVDDPAPIVESTSNHASDVPGDEQVVGSNAVVHEASDPRDVPVEEDEAEVVVDSPPRVQPQTSPARVTRGSEARTTVEHSPDRPVQEGQTSADEGEDTSPVTGEPARPPRQRRGGFERADAPRDVARQDRDPRGGLFERNDTSGDGLLSPDEVPERFRERIMTADADADGKVSREELREALPRRRPAAARISPEERRARFLELLDANADGKVQVDELPERMRERLGQADMDGDGVLSAEEWELARTRWRGRRGGPRGDDD